MMECNPGKLRLYVRSQKVPIGLTEFSRPTTIGPWIISQSSTKAVIYGHVLDDSQARLVAEAKRLSDSSGLGLEVVDLGKMGFLRKSLLSRIMGRGPTAALSVAAPSVALPTAGYDVPNSSIR